VKLGSLRRSNATAFHLYEASKIVRLIDTEYGGVARGKGSRKWGMLFRGIKVQFYKVSQS
jgi:hypothetical protein